MNSEENSTGDSSKGQFKLLVERIRTLENKQSEMENKIGKPSPEIQNKLTYLTSEINNSVNVMKNVSTEIQSVKNEVVALRNLNNEFTIFKVSQDEISQRIDSIQTEKNDFSPLEEKQDEIKQQIESFQILKNDFTSLQEKQNELTQKIDSVHSIKEDFTAIQEKQNDLTQKLESIQSIEENVDTLKNNLNEFSQKNETTQENILNDLNRINEEISKFQEKIDNGVDFQSSVNNQLKEIQEQFTNIQTTLNEMEPTDSSEFEQKLNQFEARFDGIGNRIENVEKHTGITSGALIETGFDSKGMLREFATELFGADQINQLIPDNITQDPASAVKSIKNIILNLSGMDDARIPNISEILLRYADKMEGSGVSGRKELFVAFNTDIRRICEIGQAVLMATGKKRNFSRRICQEAKNLAGKWTSEEILIGDQGVNSVLILFDTLEEEFSTP